MENMHEFDNRIKRELAYKANGIEPSGEALTQILNGIERKQARRIFYINFNKYAAAIICAVFIIAGTTFMFSDSARATALEVINSVKTVFVLDKNNKVVEKPANEAFMTGALSEVSKLGDADISKKMGLKVCFPQTINGDYSLLYKAEAVGFSNPLDYQTYEKLESQVTEAINNEEVFKSLDKYQPFRSVGAVYKNKDGTMAYIAIYNKIVPIPTENMNVTETIQTKVGRINAEWTGLSNPDYGEGDMTQKPVVDTSNHVLMWTKNGSTYEILSKNAKKLSMEKALKIAEIFIDAQK